jgi:hypothetical protein
MSQKEVTDNNGGNRQGNGGVHMTFPLSKNEKLKNETIVDNLIRIQFLICLSKREELNRITFVLFTFACFMRKRKSGRETS